MVVRKFFFLLLLNVALLLFAVSLGTRFFDFFNFVSDFLMFLIGLVIF